MGKNQERCVYGCTGWGETDCAKKTRALKKKRTASGGFVEVLWKTEMRSNGRSNGYAWVPNTSRSIETVWAKAARAAADPAKALATLNP